MTDRPTDRTDHPTDSWTDGLIGKFHFQFTVNKIFMISIFIYELDKNLTINWTFDFVFKCFSTTWNIKKTNFEAIFNSSQRGGWTPPENELTLSNLRGARLISPCRHLCRSRMLISLKINSFAAFWRSLAISSVLWKYLKVSQLYKLILKDSPYIQKLSGTNLFPCHELSQQPLVSNTTSGC